MDEEAEIVVPIPSDPPVAAVNRSFPLIAFVQFATFCAALMACVDGAAFSRFLDDFSDYSGRAAAAFVGAALIGGILGLMVGLGEHRMWQNAFKGACIGAVCGVAILCVYVAPAPLPQAFAAAIVLLVSTIGLRIGAA